jgi:hypothetical protein
MQKSHVILTFSLTTTSQQCLHPMYHRRLTKGELDPRALSTTLYTGRQKLTGY